MTQREEYLANLKRVREIARKRGLRLNTSWARVRKVVGLMSENKRRHGAYFCPCKQENTPPVKGKDVLCPCPSLAREVREAGRCYCRLFFAS